MLSRLKKYFSPRDEGLAPAVVTYLKTSYPSNHTYSIRHRELLPARKLAKRFKVIKKWYPSPLTSLLDLSCCKGFFTFAAAMQTGCERVLGVDVCAQDLVVCQEVKSFLDLKNIDFKSIYLHELALQIEKWGGLFQTVLLINAYQYLFFGSDRDSHGYFSHDKIFKWIAQVCSERVIFNNRTELADCQNRKQIHYAKSSEVYSTAAIREAASRYFRVKEIGEYGGYPLWVMDKI